MWGDVTMKLNHYEVGMLKAARAFTVHWRAAGILSGDVEGIIRVLEHVRKTSKNGSAEALRAMNDIQTLRDLLPTEHIEQLLLPTTNTPVKGIWYRAFVEPSIKPEGKPIVYIGVQERSRSLGVITNSQVIRPKSLYLVTITHRIGQGFYELTADDSSRTPLRTQQQPPLAEGMLPATSRDVTRAYDDVSNSNLIRVESSVVNASREETSGRELC